MATDIERLLADIRSLPAEDQQRLKALLGSSPNDGFNGTEPLSDERYRELLASAGLANAKKRARSQDTFDQFAPVDVKGKPLSESIVEECQ